VLHPHDGHVKVNYHQRSGIGIGGGGGSLYSLDARSLAFCKFGKKLFIQRIRPGPRLIDTFRNKLASYGEGLLAPRPTPKLEGHPLSPVRGCLFIIFAQLPSIAGGWIGLAQDRYRWRARVNAVMNLQVP
jgi:hypothetical protein